MRCNWTGGVGFLGAVLLVSWGWSGGEVWFNAGKSAEAVAATAVDWPERFQWTSGAPVVEVRDLPGLHLYSIKDPTVVRHEDRWHLFCTVRGRERSHGIVYLQFEDWERANEAQWRMLPMHDGFFCAPQVFFFRPQGKWYLICQASSPQWSPEYQPAFTTTETIGDWSSWAALRPLGAVRPKESEAWLDFWVICDDRKAHLFWTSLDGRMWRSEGSLAEFPGGWSEAELALQGDVFEASHTYRVVGERERFLTVIEAQGERGRRYYKAYEADGLAGPWREVASTRERPFALAQEVRWSGAAWSDSISHGELLRRGVDERLEVDGGRLEFLFQGVLDRDREGRPYGEIPWRLGLMRLE